jgi:undecaprenyl-diphosphatase
VGPTSADQAPPDGAPGWLDDAERVDVAVFAAIARTPTPALDAAMSRLSRAADYSRLWIGSAALIATLGGSRGRRAALAGLASVGAAAAIANLVLKPLGGRRRPATEEVPIARRAPMPASTAFPSGHAASAFAFATGVGHVLPTTSIPLLVLASLVAYSRVHVGVHYPADVITGALVGIVCARLATEALDR